MPSSSMAIFAAALCASLARSEIVVIQTRQTLPGLQVPGDGNQFACDVNDFDPEDGTFSPAGLCTADASVAMRPVNGCFNATIPGGFGLLASVPNPYCPPAFWAQANWSAFEITGSTKFASSGGGSCSGLIGMCVMTTVCVSNSEKMYAHSAGVSQTAYVLGMFLGIGGIFGMLGFFVVLWCDRNKQEKCRRKMANSCAA